MTSFLLSQVARILGIEAPGEETITGFAQDSREVMPGHFFFALRGERVDGHAFLPEVAARGGVAALVSKEYTGDHFGLLLLKIEDVLKALHDLARAVHRERRTRVIAVTGSIGKTTTKEFIAHLLGKKYYLTKTPGSANSQVGVPLSILNAKGDEELFIIEMGMSQKSEIARLVSIAPPEVGVVTNISYSHVAFFSDGIEGIAAAKAEIFSSEKTRVGVIGPAAIAFSCIWQAGNCRKIVCGVREGDYVLKREGEKVFVVERGVCSPALTLPFQASHLCENFLIAVAVARVLGLSWEEVLERTPTLTTPAKRFEKIEREGVVFINDSYNANVSSMKAALHNLPSPEKGKKIIAVLGAMKEMGEYTLPFHREVAEYALHYCDQLLCLGEECQVMVDLFQEKERPAELHCDLASLKKRVFECVEAGDVVLLKGSRSNQLWNILD